MRFHVISAVFGRNVSSYFSGVLGYLFIIVFVVAGAFLAFNEQFCTSSAATSRCCCCSLFQPSR